jgi:hypothetical protein
MKWIASTTYGTAVDQGSVSLLLPRSPYRIGHGWYAAFRIALLIDEQSSARAIKGCAGKLRFVAVGSSEIKDASIGSQPANVLRRIGVLA